MNSHRLILTVGTKLPIATVGLPIILMIDDIFAPTTLGRDPPRLILGEQLDRRSPAGLFLKIDIRELLPVAVPHDEASVVEFFNPTRAAGSGRRLGQRHLAR
jgi:hypothetical protein